MKKSLLLAAMAMPLAFAACTDDLVQDQVVNDNVTRLEGDKIVLGDNFVIAAGAGSGATESRAAWESGNGGVTWYWMPKNADNQSLLTYGNMTGYAKDSIGLCFVKGSEVLTNYKFEHDGWVEWGKEFEEDPFLCKNGEYGYTRYYLRFDQLNANSAVLADPYNATFNGNMSAKGDISNPAEGVSSKINALDEDYKVKELNLGRGIFKTDEKTIFAGNYIAYYPWSEDMISAGNLIAKSPIQMTYESGENSTGAERVAALNKYTFIAGNIGELDGGTEAAEMKFYSVSRMLSLKMDNVADDANKIVLLDVQGNFIHKMELTPEDVIAKKASGVNPTYSKTIAIDFKETIKSWVNHAIYDANHTQILVPVFETTIPAGTYALVVNSETGVAQFAKSAEVKTWKEGSLHQFFGENCASLAPFGYLVATNKKELMAAHEYAVKNNIKKILLIGEIMLDEDFNFGDVELVGHIDGVEVGSLTMPATAEPYEVTANKTVFSLNVNLKSKGCCHDANGTMELTNITLSKGMVFNNESEVTFVTPQENGANEIYGTFNNVPNTDVEEGFIPKDYEPVAPKMTLQKRATVYVYGTLNNKAEEYNGEKYLSYIKVESDDVKGATRKDAELTVSKKNGDKGTLVNDGWIDNFGTMANSTGSASQIQNREGATYVLKIGGQLTGSLLENAANRRCDFIAEVDNAIDGRWAAAWEQKLANIIKIVAEDNEENPDNEYPFVVLSEDNETYFTVNNKNVQVIVENPDVKFIGKKTTGKIENYTPVSATIGRLLIKHEGTTLINYWNQKENIEPLQLKVDARDWAGNECAVGAAKNAINVVSGKLAHAEYDFVGTTALKSIRLSVEGNFDVSGVYEEFAYLSQNGTLTAQENGKITFGTNSQFNIAKGNIVSDNQNGENGGIFFNNEVIGKLAGNLLINEKSYLRAEAGTVVTVSGNVYNNGKAWIQSRTANKVPATIYCYEYEQSADSNWTNGTPTIKK